MLKLFKVLGPFAFALVGLSCALLVARLTGSRGAQLGLHALLALPSSLLGLFIHDLMDNTMGMGNLESTLVVIGCTAGVVAGALNALWLQRRD